MARSRMLDPEDLNPNFKQFFLEKQRYGSRIPVDGYLMRSLELHQSDTFEDIFNQLVFQLEAHVLQDRLPPTTVTRTEEILMPPAPATWWDHFKVTKVEQNKWYWRWLGKLKPPLMHVESKTVHMSVDLDRWISYPEAQDIPGSFGTRYHGYSIDTKFW